MQGSKKYGKTVDTILTEQRIESYTGETIRLVREYCMDHRENLINWVIMFRLTKISNSNLKIIAKLGQAPVADQSG